MAGTDPTNYLDPLNYGASTGGAAGSAETTSTLGTNRTDARVPPSTDNVSGLQLARMRDLLQLLSQDLKGGTRLLLRSQTASPFGTGDAGIWIDTNGVMRFSDGSVARVVPTSKNTAVSTATYTVLLTDLFVGMSNSSARTVTLPSANTLQPGQAFVIKDTNGNAGTNNVTVQRAGSDTIDGATSKAISSNYGALRLYTDGSAAYFTW